VPEGKSGGEIAKSFATVIASSTIAVSVPISMSAPPPYVVLTEQSGRVTREVREVATAKVTTEDGRVQYVEVKQSLSDHLTAIVAVVSLLGAAGVGFAFNGRLAALEANNIQLNKSLGELTASISALKDTVASLRDDLKDLRNEKRS
jgi:hypothetical protein